MKMWGLKTYIFMQLLTFYSVHIGQANEALKIQLLLSKNWTGGPQKFLKVVEMF